jgi:hypothetical protein
MSFDALLHPCIQCQPLSFVLVKTCCSPSHHLVPISTNWASYSPLSMIELSCWFYGSWVLLGCWPHVESGFSTFWCADATPPASSSSLVAPLVVHIGDLEAWSGVGSSNYSVGPPLFPYGCTPLFISSNGTFLLSSEISLPYDRRSTPLSFYSSCSSMTPPSLMVHGGRFSLF